MVKIKRGMAGSRCGKGRWEPTAVLKEISKGARRQEDHRAIAEQLEPRTAAQRIMRHGDQDRYE